jgi:hypothetical protein
MPIDDVLWTNCRKCGHRYADYVKRCPRCNAKAKGRTERHGPSRQFRFTTKTIFVICVTVVAIGLYTIKVGLDIGDPAISGYSALAMGVAGAITVIIINRKVTKGMQCWWDRG